MSKKVTELPSTASLSSGDLLLVVNDPSGTPITRKITFANLVAAVTAQITGGVGRTVTVAATDPTTGEAVTLTIVGGMVKV